MLYPGIIAHENAALFLPGKSIKIFRCFLLERRIKMIDLRNEHSSFQYANFIVARGIHTQRDKQNNRNKDRARNSSLPMAKWQAIFYTWQAKKIMACQKQNKKMASGKFVVPAKNKNCGRPIFFPNFEP